jgi:BlaI family penicillinase repressor
MEELEKDKNEWKNNTVLTLLSRLGEKKFLKVKKIGRKNEYVATVTEAECRPTAFLIKSTAGM